jgi:hypothetical protein
VGYEKWSAKPETSGGQEAIRQESPPAVRSARPPERGAGSAVPEKLQNLRSLIEQLTGERALQSGVMRCPLPGHDVDDARPSFKLYVDGGWTCFTCGRGGTLADLEDELPRPAPAPSGRHVQLRLFRESALHGGFEIEPDLRSAEEGTL